MANISKLRPKFPTPSIGDGRDLAHEGLKSLPGSGKLKQLQSYLNTQGNMLKRASKDIILDTDTLNVFFDKLAGIKMTSDISSEPKIPSTNQFMGKQQSAGVKKTIIQSPIPRSK